MLITDKGLGKIYIRAIVCLKLRNVLKSTVNGIKVAKHRLFCWKIVSPDIRIAMFL